MVTRFHAAEAEHLFGVAEDDPAGVIDALREISLDAGDKLRVKWLGIEKQRLYALLGEALPTRPAFTASRGREAGGGSWSARRAAR